MTLRFEISRGNNRSSKTLVCNELFNTLVDFSWTPYNGWSKDAYPVLYGITRYNSELHLSIEHASNSSPTFLAMILDTVLVLDHVEYRFSRIEYEAVHGYYEDISATVTFVFTC